jgi:hypothetical protein
MFFIKILENNDQVFYINAAKIRDVQIYSESVRITMDDGAIFSHTEPTGEIFSLLALKPENKLRKGDIFRMLAQGATHDNKK